MAQIGFFLHFKRERTHPLLPKYEKAVCWFFSPVWKILCKIAAHGDVFRILLWSRFILFVLYTHTDQPTTFLNSPKDSRLSDGTVWFSTGAALSPIHQECKRKTIIGSREGYFFYLT